MERYGEIECIHADFRKIMLQFITDEERSEHFECELGIAGRPEQALDRKVGKPRRNVETPIDSQSLQDGL